MTTSNHMSRPLRLHLAPDPSDGLLDGAWWPYSHDLETELADLVDHFPPEVGRVSRVLFSRPDWQTHPRHIQVGRGMMKTGSFPSDDSHVVLLKLAREQQLKVMVIPPETTPDAAEQLVAEALAPTNRRSAPELIAHARGSMSS
ncbi:DUF5994 family protein [Nocardioides marmoribigeumensis]|uniref:Uncharacterized protein n=1 Tax=Nocardioides marmoribigeumensis TaxID=433649 RepID=A0ABU2BQ01_9ACTN|nr:DUF5994 family protein [Nocardioides marmoribigeumensis]MDR7360706.1 hypothetical protein [Nocardioides marmoribigeumensis]